MLSFLKKHFAGIILAILFAAYFACGIYSVESGQHAIVLRFGKTAYIVTEPGIHFHLPVPFETIRKGDVSSVQALFVQGADEDSTEKYTYDEHYYDDQYITGDENLIMIRTTISYDIKDLGDCLFSVNNVREILRSAGQECLSREMSRFAVDDVMTVGKSELRLVLKGEIQELLDNLNSGVNVISVELTDIVPPRKISSVFKAVSDARVEKQGIIRNAEGYANSVIPEARGISSRILSSAEAEADEIIKKARGETAAFLSLLKEYRNTPQVTKKQLFLKTMDTVGNKAKIIVDSNPANSTYYVP